MTKPNLRLRPATQHTTPCHDCPWRRKAIPGWLGEDEAKDWIERAHGECAVECHTNEGHQCAGMAIYRANVAKSTRYPSLILELPHDTVSVFASPAEFYAHHDKSRHYQKIA